MNKKLLFIIIFILGILIFAFLIYFIFFREMINPPVNNANVAGNENINAVLPNVNITNRQVNAANVNAANVNALPNVNAVPVNKVAGPDEIARGSRTLVNPVVSAYALNSTLTADGKGLMYYDPRTGKFYKINPDGTGKTELSDQQFPSVDKISWSPKKDKAIISFPDNTNILYDFSKKQQITLPGEWEDIVFSPEGEQVAFKHIATNEDDRWLAIANPDGTQIQAIEPIGDKQDDVQVNWSPSNQVIATYRESVDGETQEIIFLGKYDENFKSFVADGKGFEGSWSTKGDKIVYSVYNSSSNYNPKLYVVEASGDSIGQNKKDLGVQTWSNKCAFSSDNANIYCAVPKSLPEGSGMMPSLADSTTDIFYKINLNTGLRSLLAEPESATGAKDYNVSSIFLSDAEDYMYFSDKLTGNVYRIKLK